MNRLLPRPGLSLALLFSWLVINASVSNGHLFLGVLLALWVPLLTDRLYPQSRLKIKSWTLALRLFLVFLGDIVVANLTVAWQVLFKVGRLQPAFVDIPLALKDPFLVSMLASMITLTPGTVSIAVDPEDGRLSVHVLHCTDTAALVAQIQYRYERVLMEVFEC